MATRVTGGAWLFRGSAPNTNSDYTLFFRWRRSRIDLLETLFYVDAGTGDQSADWLYFAGDNTIGFRRFADNGSNDINVNGTTAFTSTTTDILIWLVRTGTTYNVYIGSNTTPELVGSGADVVIAATRMALGAGTPGWDPTDGAISDAAIWSEAVSAANRAAVVSGGASAYTTNQWARWKLDVHTATADLSGNSRNLSVSGTVSTTTNPVVPGGSTDATVTPTGFALALAQGTPVTAITITPIGFALTATRGTPTPSNQSSTTVTPTGLALSSSLGTFNIQNDMTILPGGGDLGLTLGTPTIIGTTVGNILITPSGFALGLGLGQIPTQVLPVGLPAALVLGTPTLSKSQVIQPVGFLLSLAQSAPGIAGAVSAVANIPIRKGWITRRRGRK